MRRPNTANITIAFILLAACSANANVSISTPILRTGQEISATLPETTPAAIQAQTKNTPAWSSLEATLTADQLVHGPITVTFSLLLNTAKRGLVVLEGALTRSESISSGSFWTARVFLPPDQKDVYGNAIIVAQKVEAHQGAAFLGERVVWNGSPQRWPDNIPAIHGFLVPLLATPWASTEETQDGMLVDARKAGFEIISDTNMSAEVEFQLGMAPFTVEAK